MIDAYRAAGFGPFPCKGELASLKFEVGTDKYERETKAPIFNGWQSVAPYQFTDAELGVIYGVNMPATLVVFDYDPRKDTTQGKTQLKDFKAEFALHAIPTFIVKTGSGGEHIYHSKPSDLYVAGSVPGYPAIDIKAGPNGYVIGAGSWHFSGNSYEVLTGSPGAVTPAPPELLARIDASKREAHHRAPVHIATDELTKSRYMQYLLTCPESGTYKRAAHGRELGLPAAIIVEYLWKHWNGRRAIPHTIDALREKVEHAEKHGQNAAGHGSPVARFAGWEFLGADYHEILAQADNGNINWVRRFDRAGNESLVPTSQNVKNYFYIVPWEKEANPLYDLIRLNLMSDAIEFVHPAPWHKADNIPINWSDHDTVQLQNILERRQLFVTEKQIINGVSSYAYEKQYHPVRNWLNGLKWDGVPRLDLLLPRYAGAPNNRYTRTIGACTLIAAVARVMQPGCKHDHMLVLEGEQGTGKSTFVSVLGGSYYADIKIDTDNKDTIQTMQGKWILEASEMEFLKRSDVASLKRFLTIQTDVIRKSFGRFTSDLKRQSIFIGTLNPTGNGYLIDPTGNRRFWPVETTSIDIPALQADREQLFAEALYRYRSGEAWHLVDPELEKLARQEQNARMETDLWDEVIGEYLSREFAPNPIHTTQICYGALNLPVGKIDRSLKLRLANTMRNLGYELKSIKIDGRTKTMWYKEPPDLLKGVI